MAEKLGGNFEAVWYSKKHTLKSTIFFQRVTFDHTQFSSLLFLI